MRYLLLALTLLTLTGCAKTIIKATLPNGTVLEFFDDKSRSGTKMSVALDAKGYPLFDYSSETSDASAVALRALGLADTVINTAAKVAGP